MTYRGKVKDGIIVVDGPSAPPEGAEVTIRVLKANARPPGARKAKPSALYEAMKPLIGIAKDLPSDFARNHDHYLHGQPKK